MPICGHILTEAGDKLLTESGGFLVTECFTPATTLPNAPGKVWRGSYPYWVPPRKKRPPYEDEDELISMLLGE